MKTIEFVQVAFFFIVVIIMTPLLGSYMAKVLEGKKHLLSIVTEPIEKVFYRFSGINPSSEMSWTQYLWALLIFNFLGFIALLALQLLQSNLPFNPQNFPDVPFWLALNTAVSFVTNTNWQAYSGEATLSYLVQMIGLTVQNFLSAATGIAVLAALARGLARKNASTVGNFWADMTRATLCILIPLAIILSILLVSQGVVQTFSSYANAVTLEGKEQVIPLGPAASQIAIKQLGTNGGGFFGVNSAHPFENPTPFSNFLELLAIILIPAALTYTFGRLIGNRRHAWCLFAVMMIILIASFSVSWYSETLTNPAVNSHVWMEGKETRLGVMNSVLWANVTTVASNGSVNAMHDSLTPLAGMMALFNMMLGEIIFGGVGTGIYTIILYVLLTVFLAGLMVGRTPEYLGKKIEAREMVWALIGILLPGIILAMGSAIACVTESGLSSLGNSGPHGLTEILYAFTSAAENNGSAFAGLNANTPFYNILLSIAMFLGRFGVIIPVLAICGSLVRKKISAPSQGTFPTNGLSFIILLISVILIVGALTFFPMLALGPIMEHFLMLDGRTF